MNRSGTAHGGRGRRPTEGGITAFFHLFSRHCFYRFHKQSWQLLVYSLLLSILGTDIFLIVIIIIVINIVTVIIIITVDIIMIMLLSVLTPTIWIT